ncbi:hypothetical protein V2J09_006562 [Rumex salicifolius]
MSFVAPTNQLLYELSMGGRWNTFGFQFICLMVLVLCSCLRGCSSLDSEGIDLLKFREGIYYDPYDALARWNSDDHDPCVWSRVHCLDGKVQTLDLSGLSLQGTLAPQLGNLKDLRDLILQGNQFSGPIPRELGILAKLELLDLSENNLNGDIPVEITRMASLKRLFLCGNNFDDTNLLSMEELNSLLELQFDAVLDSSTARAHCIYRKFDRRSEAANSQDQNLQTSYNPATMQNVALHLGSYRRRRLLDQSSNLEARPTKLDSPSSQIVSSPISRGSGSFPAVSKPTKATHPKAPSPAPAHSPTSISLPSKGIRQSKISDKRWIYVSVAIGAALLIAIGMVVFYVARKRVVTTIRPWKTGISGQLQKAFVTGVPKLNRSELEGACEDFSNIIETRDGCTIYKGTLSSGVEIAVASTVVTSAKDWSEEAEFSYRRNIETLSRVNHKNFVNLIGYCEENEPFSRMMVYEYAPNGTLFEHLHVKELEHLDWGSRMRISMGVAYCLQHMHDLYPPVLHSYLSSNVIYLTDDYAAKIAERVFTKLPVREEVISREDEQKLLDYLPTCSPESNIHNFGVLLLEIITGKVPRSREHGFLLEWSFKQEELEIVCELIKDCIKAEPRQRPTIREVTDRLREVLRITPEAAVPRLSPLWWAELEILSVEAA